MPTVLKRRDRPLPDQRLNRRVIIAGAISLVVYVALGFWSPKKPLPYADQMIAAARIMREATATIVDYQNKAGIEIDDATDPNHTGLVGPEQSELATTLGHLEAKRTTTNPDMAGLIVHLLHESGVESGDTIAVGCSGSFPALMVATLSATKVMDVYPVVILSLGASSFGGTRMDFNLLDMYQLLLRENVFAVRPTAISLGGEQDTGQELEPETRARLIKQIRESGFTFIYETDLQKNVAARMKIYSGGSSTRRIAAFINIGGSHANLGTSGLALNVQPGLNMEMSIPPKPERGVLFEMAAERVPCVHLLFIKGLVMKYGLPWDPIPLPEPGRFVSPK